MSENESNEAEIEKLLAENSKASVEEKINSKKLKNQTLQDNYTYIAKNEDDYDPIDNDYFD